MEKLLIGLQHINTVQKKGSAVSHLGNKKILLLLEDPTPAENSITSGQGQAGWVVILSLLGCPIYGRAKVFTNRHKKCELVFNLHRRRWCYFMEVDLKHSPSSLHAAVYKKLEVLPGWFRAVLGRHNMHIVVESSWGNAHLVKERGPKGDSESSFLYVAVEGSVLVSSVLTVGRIEWRNSTIAPVCDNSAEGDFYIH